MEATLAEIEFLALSANRVTVLTCLASTHHTRSELAEVTGASQATLGRILGDFEDRNWARREAGGYVATATGRLIAESFGDLLDVFDVEAQLRELVDYLPSEAMTFDFRQLADATITTPSETRPNAPLQRLLGQMETADSVTAFSHAFNDQSLSVVADQLGDQQFEAVLSRRAVDSLVDDDVLQRRLRSITVADSATVRVYDGEIPLAVTVTDDVVTLLVRDNSGVLQAAIDTSNSDIRAWASERFDHYWAQSSPLSL